MISVDRQLVIAVPALETYLPHSGIGRVFHSLSSEWGAGVRLISASLKSYPFPVLRNFPFKVHVPAEADVVLLPKLSGSQALRNTNSKPSVVIVHDVGIVDFPGDRESYDWVSQQSIKQSFYGLPFASHIVTDSNFTRQRLLQYLPLVEDRISVIHAGVNNVFLNSTGASSQSRQRLQGVLGQQLRAPLLIYVGSELPRKNMSLLLGVFKEIQAQFPTAQLLKVGSAGSRGWRTKTLKICAELGLKVGTDVVLLENVDDHVLADAYRSADVFVSTSLYEGFGLPALEAMATGTPVVVTNRGSFPEIVGDAGWVVEPTLDGFVRAVNEALLSKQDDYGRLKMTERAKRFSWSTSAKQILGIVEACVHGFT